MLSNETRVVCISIMVLAALMFGASIARAQTSAGSVTAASGDVHIERAGTSIPATVGTAVDVGDKIVTGANGLVTITLSDASRLDLEESANVTIDEHMVSASARETHVSVFSGVLRSFVNYTSGVRPDFEVHTPNAVASARGTDYDTSYKHGVERKEYKGCRRYTDVRVYKGVVAVTNTTNPAGGTVDVHEGHKTVVACFYPPSQESPIGAAAAATPPAAGNTTGETVGLLLGNGIVIGGVIGGLDAAGVFSSSSHNTSLRHPNTGTR